ncbi:MAG: potassium channel family protein [Candidatus Omnitrophica bacterium]|nr:potassium channel family protein [Candidatus Omnitrophota bacterium]
MIFACAVIYRFSGDVIAPAGQSAVSFFDTLYMSVISFTTVGYGDFLPSGWIRGIAMLEALSGICAHADISCGTYQAVS